MKRITDLDIESINDAHDWQWRRIRALEQDSAVVVPTTAPRAPTKNQMWLDVEAGKLNVWNGSSYDKWTKDT